MIMLARLLTAAALVGTAAAPAAAQYPYPYPQPYPQTYPPYGYPGTGQGVVGTILDSLLGRYAVNDRTAIRQCANAAIVQAQNQYRGYGGGYGGYPQPYGGYAGYNIRVTAITDVERRSDGLRIRGLLDSGMYAQPYGVVATGGDLTFRCTVDYRGYVTNVRVRPNTDYRRY